MNKLRRYLSLTLAAGMLAAPAGVYAGMSDKSHDFERVDTSDKMQDGWSDRHQKNEGVDRDYQKVDYGYDEVGYGYDEVAYGVDRVDDYGSDKDYQFDTDSYAAADFGDTQDDETFDHEFRSGSNLSDIERME